MIFANNPTRIACVLIIRGQIFRIEFECPTYMFVPFFFQILRIDFECPTCMFLPFFQIGMYTDEAPTSGAPDVDLGPGSAARVATAPWI